MREFFSTQSTFHEESKTDRGLIYRYTQVIMDLQAEYVANRLKATTDSSQAFGNGRDL
jgi:hypothetical protein